MTSVGDDLRQKMKRQKLATAKDGVKTPGGDIAFKDILEIAKNRHGGTLNARVTMILGTCLSGGVTVDGGRDPREIQKEIKDGTIQIQ